MRLARGSAEVYCPYCYEEISRQPTWYRCTGQNGPNGKRCAAEVDPVLRDRTGYSGALPPAFAAGRGRNADACPGCAAKTGIVVCPVCHSRLPVHFGRAGSHLIVPVGAKEAGKSVFMTVLVHELMNQAGEQLNAAITGADDPTRQRFTGEYEQPLYRESQLLEPTKKPDEGSRPPLVFRFTSERPLPRILAGSVPPSSLPGIRDPQRTVLSFFDTAGEDLRSHQVTEQNVPYLSAASGIVLLLDPLQMRGARELAAPGSRLPTLGKPEDEPANVLEIITDVLLLPRADKPGQRIDKPLAIVFTKVDTLWESLKETSPLRQSPPRNRYFDEADSMAVHAEIQRLLARWEGSRIDRIARLNYRKYRYFGVSALGETPTEDNRVSPRGIRPYRVTDPVLWLLAQFGTIPVK
ncbi:MAG TPA: hypothetical protein VFW50_31185 [Streptosporangiaceae bacterium]|nr:hypothetical protein [Streptosporangiaceae bacterium]